MTGHWDELDHTADVAIAVFGSDLETLFTTSAQALFSLAFEPGKLHPLHQFTVILTAPDPETLIIDWLNELLYLSDKNNAYFFMFEFQKLQPTELTACVEATCIRSIKCAIKAATFHNIAIIQAADGFRTEIVFDT